MQDLSLELLVEICVNSDAFGTFSLSLSCSSLYKKLSSERACVIWMKYLQVNPQQGQFCIPDWRCSHLASKLEKLSGLSCISLIIPPNDKITRIAKMFSDEYGTCSGIKSRVRRLNVMYSIVRVQHQLKKFSEIPKNGLYIYEGSVPTDIGTEKRYSFAFEPPFEIKKFFYQTDDKFFVESLKGAYEPLIGVVTLSTQHSHFRLIQNLKEMKTFNENIIPLLEEMGNLSGLLIEAETKELLDDFMKSISEKTKRMILKAAVDPERKSITSFTEEFYPMLRNIEENNLGELFTLIRALKDSNFIEMNPLQFFQEKPTLKVNSTIFLCDDLLETYSVAQFIPEIQENSKETQLEDIEMCLATPEMEKLIKSKNLRSCQSFLEWVIAKYPKGVFVVKRSSFEEMQISLDKIIISSK